MQDWRVMHYEIMKDFLMFLNTKSNRFVLKGGTSLLFCYGLTRFSEDIDLDGFDDNFFEIVDMFVMDFKNKYLRITYGVVNNTDTMKSVRIYYGGRKSLKIDVSYRKKVIDMCEYCNIDGVWTYKVPRILSMKLNVFNHRERIRDLYDIVFIYNTYKSRLDSYVLFTLRDAIAYKGLEHFDYLIKDQTDELIDNSKLAESFLYMYYDLGLV